MYKSISKPLMISVSALTLALASITGVYANESYGSGGATASADGGSGGDANGGYGGTHYTLLHTIQSRIPRLAYTECAC